MKNEFKTQIESVSEWVTGLRYDDIPAEVLGIAKMNLLNSFASICAGSRSSAGVNLKLALKNIESGGPCTVFPDGENWSIENTLFFHAAMINALELDDFVFMGHVSQSSISSSLALGMMKKLTGKEFLTALIAAVEVSGRFGAYMATGPQQGHMRAFVHRVASAVAASKIFGLDPRTTAKAIAIALSLPEFPLYPASFSPDTKVICTSPPTVEGVKATFMAMNGIDGPLDIIENPAGFFAFFSYSDQIPEFWRWIGKTWTLYSFSAKKFATCAYAHGPVNAAFDLYKSKSFALEDVHKINIYAPMSTLVMEKFSKPHYNASITPVNTNFSTIRSVAATLAEGELNGAFFKHGEFEKKIESIEKYSPKCNLLHDWQMTIDLLRGMDNGLENAGRPGFLSLNSSQKTLKQFKAAFGSRTLFRFKDIFEFPKVKSNDQIYFLRRYWRSFISKLESKKSFENKDRFFSHEGNLQKMAFRLSGRVEVILKNNKKFESTCILPPGFADDSSREKVVLDKYFRECIPVWGEEKTKKIKEVVMNISDLNIGIFASLLQK